MAKKFFSKALSVGLSLALCAGMVMPALAWAPLRDEYIDENGVLQGHDWEDGISYDYYLEDDYVLDQTLVVEDGVQATIDLNGHDLKLNDSSEIIKDDDGYLEDIEVADSSGEVKEGSVISVDGEDTKLTVYGNKEEKDAEYERGEGIGGITGGYEKYCNKGAGVNVGMGAKFEMIGGSIYGNRAQNGSGLYNNQGTAVLTDTSISWNYADLNSPALVTEYGSPTTLNNVEVSHNTSEDFGASIGVIDSVYDFVMNGGSIHHNRTKNQDEYAETINHNAAEGIIKLNGVEIYDNDTPRVSTTMLCEYTTTLVLDEDGGSICLGNNGEGQVTVTFTFASIDRAEFETTVENSEEEVALSIKGIESLTVYDADGEPTTYEFGEDTKAVFHSDGTITIENGGVVKEDGKETIYVGGADVDGFDYTNGEDNDGEVSIVPKGDTITKTDDGDGKVTITGQDGDGEDKFETEIILPDGKDGSDVTVDGDGTTNVPEGGKVTGEDGKETTYPNGTTIDKDGNVNGDGTDPSITKDKETGDVTIDDGKGGTTEVEVPDGDNADVKVNDDGTVTVTLPDGGKVTDKDGKETDLPAGSKITIDKNGNVTLPKVDDDDDDDNGGNNSGSSNVFENYDFGAGTTNIEDEAVPLAGIVSIQDVLAELYRRAGSPDGADAEGEYDRAVAWALANELIDDETDVEAVVTVAALRAILANYAKVFGANAVAAEDLTTLTGEDDDVVMNCDEVLAEFFGEEYVPAKDEEEAAA